MWLYQLNVARSILLKFQTEHWPSKFKLNSESTLNSHVSINKKGIPSL